MIDLNLIPEWAPNIHPMLVHFPIALLLIAVLGSLVSLFIPDKWWDEQKNTVLYVLGALSAIVVYYTGQAAADSVFLPSQAQSVLNNHADWAFWTVWYFGIYALARITLHRYEMMSKLSLRVIAFAIALPGLFFLYQTGDHGAKMVFGYGAGTGQLMEQQPTGASATTDSLQQSNSTFKVHENGNWSWEMGPSGVSTLLSEFQWLVGSPQDLRPSIVNSGDNSLLKLSLRSSPNFFITLKDFLNVQVDYYLDLSDFDGEVELVNHVHDAQNYDFVTISSKGTITQGRVIEGETNFFGEETYSANGMLFVRTVVNGTHFRAYINKEMAVHGHGDAPNAGAAGLRLNGSGVIIIDKVSLTQLD
ncbi:DUF2231 domain-containing protein [Gracilimonas tropica]|uniref:DUF2231 domain-containing protein n=1 Tax=Gracilimonas tropica TaxID=454600 RepID=UPI0003814A50|nr:DUF2231 domain-containing protein [Gracilimonas tropica]